MVGVNSIYRMTYQLSIGIERKKLEMNDSDAKVILKTTCPKGHRVTPLYSREELRKSLERDKLQFYCGECESPWEAGPEEKANISKRLADGSL